MNNKNEIFELLKDVDEFIKIVQLYFDNCKKLEIIKMNKANASSTSSYASFLDTFQETKLETKLSEERYLAEKALTKIEFVVYKIKTQLE